MFGAFIHVSEMTDNEAGSLGQSAVEPSATPGTSFMCISTQEKHFGWSKRHVGALEWSFKSFFKKALQYNAVIDIKFRYFQL